MFQAWPFEEAKKIMDRLSHHPKTEVLFETGYGPSGLPHIGTFGEVLRTTMVRHAFQTLNPDIKTRLICFSDDMDGFRKVPTNIPNQDLMTANLHKPLTSVPDPYNQYESFAHHNNAMLRRFLDSFGFHYEFMSSTEVYRSGQFDETLKKILHHYDDVMNVMLPSLRAERQGTYSPFLPLCPTTNRVLQVPLEQRNVDSNTIVYKDPDTQKFVEVSILGGHCKLQWKVDWACRWAAFDVDYEMCGKDLIDSVKLSSKITSIIGGTPPQNLVYELFLDDKGEKISKSKGNGLTIDEWLAYAPQESLAYYMYQKPSRAKRLYFDVIPKSVDEYMTYLESYSSQEDIQQKENPVWHIHEGNVPLSEDGPTFSLLLNLVSVCSANDAETVWGFVARYNKNATKETMPFLDRLIHLALAYYRDFIEPNKSYKIPNDDEKQALQDLYNSLQNASDNASFDELQTLVFEVGKKYYATSLRDWFKLLYEVLLGQTEGPRMGSFIELYGLQDTLQLIHSKLHA
jgi:lysyl-tRNA synthetase class 1